MQPLATPSRPLRRLVAALLTLSVLLTSLAWAHSGCATMSGHPDGATVTAGHLGVAGMLAASGTRDAMTGVAPGGAGGEAGYPADRCASHGCQSAPEEGGCAMMAHCTTAVASSAAVVLEPALHAPSRPAIAPPGRPLDRAYQPDAPPPKA